jgi:hypothetical protein
MADEPIKDQNSGEENDEYFDDCPICQAMKKMKIKEKLLYNPENDGVFDNTTKVSELSEEQLEELKAAFKQAKDGGAIVGGEWFNKE